jgi:NRAMP (natural resistance-associated macrophage protein)-like metal ion transporter
VLPTVARADPRKDRLLKRSPADRAVTAAGGRTLRSGQGASHLIGPGLITGASDDDPSGIGTYSQVGSQYGYGLLWTALLTFPLMAAVQEMCARIALATGEGLGVSLRRRFPTALVAASVGALVIANTINVGADLGAIAASCQLVFPGLPAPVLVVAAAGLVLAFQLFSTYSVLFSTLRWLTLALLAYVATLFVVRPPTGEVLTGALVPRLQFDAGWIAAVVAVLGTTISPYLFFWQASSEVDELRASGRRRRPLRDSTLTAARADVFVGMALSQIVMFCIIATSAAALHAHGQTDVETAQQAAATLEPLAGRFATLLFAAGIVGTGLLAVPVLTASAAYAVREVGNFGGGLAIRPRYRPTFYGIIIGATVAGCALDMLGFNPIHALFVTAVINGLVAPPLLILITVVASDGRIMGDRRSRRLSRSLAWTTAALMSLAAVGLVATVVRI